MRVAYDHQIFAAQQYGGISRYFVELASRVSRAPGVTAKVLALAHMNEHLAQAPPDLVAGRHVNSRFKQFFGVLDTLVAPVGLALFRPDVVHETYYSGRRLAPRGAGVVVTVYDMIHELYTEAFPSSDHTATFKAAAVARADHVICISENTRRDLLKSIKVSPEKISVIHLGWNLDTKSPEIPLPVHGPYLLYVGSRVGYKNFSRLLEAFARSVPLRRDYKLVAFGGGPFTTAELNEIGGLNLDSSRVLHFGGGDPVLAALYRGASAFIYPSLYEGFGIPPLEAMSYGCPVICSSTSSLPEVAGPAAAYFDPLDVESLQATIERVLGSVELGASLIALGRKRVEQFSWDRCAQETLAVYRQL